MVGVARLWTANCAETAGRLSDYLEDELVGWRRRRVRAHLARCPRCTAVLASLTRTVEALRALGALAAPGSSSRAIVGRVRAEAR